MGRWWQDSGLVEYYACYLGNDIFMLFWDSIWLVAYPRIEVSEKAVSQPLADVKINSKLKCLSFNGAIHRSLSKKMENST